MYKKIIFALVAVMLLFLSGCNINQSQESNKTLVGSQYIKSVFISYYELSEFTCESNESEFKQKINKAFKELSSNGFNRVTVHIRPCADAFYKSDYFPVSEYCFGEQGAELIYDPLEIMVELAHKHNLSIEAWINPYRVSQNDDFSKLSSSNMAFQWRNTDKVCTVDGAIYFNPSDDEVISLIVNGVGEVAQNYGVDSICFDDYFYPAKSSDIDKNNYEKYKKDGGDKSLQEWRRDNVSAMVSAVYAKIKEINPTITFGISPASNIENDYSSLYADVEKWMNNEGYVDYICPQIYFGFQNENQPFMQTVKKWCSSSNCDLYVALPLYKASKEDEYAGDGGRLEFLNNSNVISRQVIYLSKIEQIKGFYIFSYSSLKNNDETKNLYSAMQNSSQ